jgi:hypothetical protein
LTLLPYISFSYRHFEAAALTIATVLQLPVLEAAARIPLPVYQLQLRALAATALTVTTMSALFIGT